MEPFLHGRPGHAAGNVGFEEVRGVVVFGLGSEAWINSGLSARPKDGAYVALSSVVHGIPTAYESSFPYPHFVADGCSIYLICRLAFCCTAKVRLHTFIYVLAKALIAAPYERPRSEPWGGLEGGG